MNKIKDVWAGGDPDDVNGYLMDYLNSKFSTAGVPLTDEELYDKMEDGRFAEEILFNIRNAVRAKNEDFDE